MESAHCSTSFAFSQCSWFFDARDADLVTPDFGVMSLEQGQMSREQSGEGTTPLAGRRVILGITGGIAAYKAAELCRLLVKAGASVRVVMTEAAARFITP